MSYDKKVLELVSSLIELTNHDELKWMPVREYLEEDKNEVLRKHLIYNHQYYDSNMFRSEPIINEYNSFTSSYKKGLIHLFQCQTGLGDSYYLATQQQKSSGLIKINSPFEFQNELKSLFSFVKNQVDNIDSFIDVLIQEGKKLKSE